MRRSKLSNQRPADDLTNEGYWAAIHAQQVYSRETLLDATGYPWLPIILAYLRPYEGGRFLELGCAPGRISALICSKMNVKAEGVDSSPEAESYLRNMALTGISDAVLHKCDVRNFATHESFDIVASFGLVEHFQNPQEILDCHDRFLKPGGLCVVVVPHFRRIQFLYHRLFDGGDLKRHNLKAMDPRLFREFAARLNHTIVELRYVGHLRFWGEDPTGPSLIQRLRHYAAVRIRSMARGRLGRYFGEGNPFAAPWLVYVGRKAQRT